MKLILSTNIKYDKKSTSISNLIPYTYRNTTDLKIKKVKYVKQRFKKFL